MDADAVDRKWKHGGRGEACACGIVYADKSMVQILDAVDARHRILEEEELSQHQTALAVHAQTVCRSCEDVLFVVRYFEISWIE